MAVCPTCGAEMAGPGMPCPGCGRTAPAVPDLDLAIASSPAPKPRAPAPKKAKPEEASIDFAVDLASLRPQAATPPMLERTSAAPPGSANAPMVTAAAHAAARPQATPLALDQDLEARTLANYGAPPSNVFVTPLYALRVWKRRTELRTALAGRREEAAQAARAVEDAMCALGERVRPLAATDAQASRSLQLLRESEDLLRARDATLAREQDQHNERLRALDQRMTGVEAELVTAKSEERAIAGEIESAQASVQRAETKLKRAEIELRSAQSAQSARRTGA